MNKTELIDAVATKASLNKKEASAAVAAVIDTITDALVNGDKVQIIGFGTFEVKKRLERVVVNPGTQQRMLVPPKLVLNFRPISSIKEILKNNGGNQDE